MAPVPDAMVTRVLLIRHGETEWNKQGIFRGIADVPLNGRGARQAEAIGKTLAGTGLRAIYASRLVRASDTAQAIASRQASGIAVTPEDAFVDIHRGEWEGLTHDQAREKYPELYKRWFASPQDVRFPGGDSLRDVQRRARAALDRIARELAGSELAVVTHHVVIRALLCSLLDLELSHFRRFEAYPGSITEARFEYDHWVLYRLNDVCHLGGEG